MNKGCNLTLALRRQHLGTNTDGFLGWETVIEPYTVPADRLAIVLCDVWDRHWCRGADTRLAALLPRMNQVACVLRDAGSLIVHAPSDTMAFYAGTPARERVLHAPRRTVPAPRSYPDPPLPVDASDEGCDTPPDTPHQAWSQQHPAITIDHDRDAISDDGVELYGLYQQHGIQMVLVMGVHTNMCILQRSFAIKAMVRWGYDVALVRDLTDTMYNPAMSPYVNHAEGTNLVVEYIEKFWCPTVSSDNLLQAPAVAV